MILPLLQAALGAIGTQALPERGCAAYLWRVDDRRLVAMAGADPATLRLSVDGRALDLPRVAAWGDAGAGLGLGAGGDYRAGEVAATLELEVAADAGLRDGALVPRATLRLRTGAGADELLVPLAGLIGCAPDPSRRSATK